MNDVESCSRCGFTVNFAGASEVGRARLERYIQFHREDCPRRADGEETRRVRRENAREAFFAKKAEERRTRLDNGGRQR